MSISNIKKLLEANSITVSDEDIKAKIVELGLNPKSLGESGVTAVVDSFVGTALAVSAPKTKSQLSFEQKRDQKIDSAKQKVQKGLGDKIRADVDAFEKPLETFSEQLSSDEATRIYESYVAAIPAKIIAKTADLIANHQGDTKSCNQIGSQFATALLSDFYANQE